jgi:hypothetical protein
MDKELREQTSKFLRSHGYDSVDDLDRAIVETVEGKALDDWQELKSQYACTERPCRSVFC